MKLFLFLLVVAAAHARNDCSEHCVCNRVRGGTVAICTRLEATQKFTKDVMHLVLKKDNHEEKISFEDGIFSKVGLDQLYSIQAMNVSLNSVHANAFTGLDNLNEVDLSDNDIILIHPDTFKNNTNLKRLTLSGNPLQLTQVLKSEQDYFLSSTSLRTLELARCQLGELKPNTFSHLPNLEYINLASNNLKELHPQTFSSVKFLDEIDLSNNNISNLSNELFFDIEDLTTLNLSNNSINNFHNIDIADLKLLDLSDNYFTSLSSMTFEGVPDLTHLYIRNNKIKTITEDTFTNLQDLRYLDLSNNHLKGPLPKYIFEQNKDLETLSLAGNRDFTDIGTIAGEFNVLYKLDMSNCGLKSLAADSFNTMPYLSILNLSGNLLTDIHQSSFIKLRRLNDLDLSHNELTKLETDLFINNSHLRKLNLSSNKIHHIPVTLFKPLPLLSILDLSNNLISYLWHLNNSEYIKSNAILARVEYLNLNGNQLKSVHRSNFEIFVSLKTLDIFNNPLHCGQLFASLIEWLISNKITSANYVGKSQSMELKSEPNANNIQWTELWRQVCDAPYVPPKIEEHEDDTKNKIYYITDETPYNNIINDNFITDQRQYFWPTFLIFLCGLSVVIAIGNLVVLLIYRLRGSSSYHISGYKSAFVSPFRQSGMKTDGSSRYHKLYEECSVPNPPVAKSKVFTAPIMDSLAKLHYSVITKPEVKDENLV